MKQLTEREVKLAAPPTFRLPSLDGLIEGVVVGAPVERNLDAVYFDTVDLRLARWGITVRHRTGEGDTWTVKLPDANDGPGLVRRELSFEGPAGAVPAPVGDLVRGYVRTATLAPVARLKTRRRGYDLRDAEGQRVAEVVDDEVSVYEGRRLAGRFREIEVELVGDASADLLPAVIDELRDAGAGEPDPMPKLMRALGPRAQAPPELPDVVLGDKPSAGEVVRAALSSGVVRVLQHDPGVRIGDDPEDVHQARVGTRRLRSDLRTFGPLLQEPWTTGLRDELRWLGEQLGAVRDADVLLERFRRQAATLPERDARGVATVLRRLARQREAARASLLEAMTGARYANLLDRLVDAAREPALSEDADRKAADVVPELVSRPWRHLNRAVKKLDDDPPDEDLHKVRIRAKRCRYAAEAAAPVIGKPARRLAKAVAGLQSVLGDHQDAVVAEGWLRDAAAASGVSALAAGELIGLQRAEAAATREAWPAAWKAIRAAPHDWLP